MLAQILPDCDEILTLSYENLENWRAEAEIAKERKALKEQEIRKKSEKSDLGVLLRGGLWVIDDSRSDEVQSDS